MPLTWVYPAKFLTSRGVSIYLAYKNDTLNNPLQYSYTTDVYEDEAFQFDIRDLKEYKEMSEFDHKAVLRQAIKNKSLKLPEEV
jgi:hypothetical protein